MHTMVPTQKDALTFLAERRGPYSKPDSDTGEMVSGFWHKPEHTGSDTCIGCAVEEGLQATPIANNTAP